MTVMGSAMKYDRQELIELLKTDALQFGDFVLSSGKRASFYIDGRKVTLSSRGAALIGAGILELLSDTEFEAVGGLTLGADPIIGAVLTIAGIDGRPLRGCIVRKEPKGHATGKLVEGSLNPGDRVVVVEDTSTTGGSCLKAVRAIEAEGCKVVHIVSVLDRLEGAAQAFQEQGYPFSALTNIRDLGIQ